MESKFAFKIIHRNDNNWVAEMNYLAYEGNHDKYNTKAEACDVEDWEVNIEKYKKYAVFYLYTCRYLKIMNMKILEHKGELPLRSLFIDCEVNKQLKKLENCWVLFMLFTRRF